MSTDKKLHKQHSLKKQKHSRTSTPKPETHDEEMDEFSDEPQEFELDDHNTEMQMAEEGHELNSKDHENYHQHGDGDSFGADPNGEKKMKTLEETEKTRLARTEQKALLKDRKMQRSHAPMIMEAKTIWEELRQKRLKKQERRELMNRMMGLVTGKAKEIIFKHDASRIIQCCLKYGSPSQRDQIAKELSGHYAQLSQSQYGRFIVSKILNYCSPEYRSAVISEFYGKVRKLIRHKEVSLILDEAYSQFANAAQRSALMEEFYGPEYAVFKSLDGSRTLKTLLETQPEKKPSIMRYLRQTLDSVLQKGSFNLSKTPILHRAIYEYLTYADLKVAKDMIELLKDHLVHILHTRDGARIAQYCILHATPKDRKHIIKSFKGFVHAIATEQYGHSVLLTCFECIDDTVIVSKSLIAELLSPSSSSQAPGTEKTASRVAVASAGAAASISELLRNKYGSRVILFLLAGRNKKYQPAYLIQELAEMDEIRAKTSKKEDGARRQQLLDSSAPLIVQAVSTHVNELLRDRIGGQIVIEALYSLSIDVSAITSAILALVPKNLDPAGTQNSKKIVFEEDNDEWEDDQDNTSESATDMATDPEDAPIDATSLLQEDSPIITDGDLSSTEKPFNAVTKLKSERDAANLVAQGLDMVSSLFVNRESTRTLKQLVGKPQAGTSGQTAVGDSLAQDQPLYPTWQPAFATALFDLVAPKLSVWLTYCAQDPRGRSGTALIFVAMHEMALASSKDNQISSDLAQCMKTAMADIDVKALALTITAAKDAENEKASTVTAPIKGKNKRKRTVDSDGASNTPSLSKSAIETLISNLG
ncbi:hypothetical protein BASA50_003317 [Batrachochytrium salamandrivorans]|uniref:PUM-HD domain-containing protein n=1 Tax=Batrachochytrium salamandrivorans TaxID=1357716 RepID=A0ABQ8FIV5_9FUNG|nr:hypothetical protein BASA50_003317 [Batrachochytrium salamandrivorans]